MPFRRIPVIPVDSGAIPADSGAIPVESGHSCRNLWGTEKYCDLQARGKVENSLKWKVHDLACDLPLRRSLFADRKSVVWERVCAIV